MKKKVLTILLAAAMVITLFTGCGGSAKSEAAFDNVMPEMESPMEAPGAGEVGFSKVNGAAEVPQQKLIRRVSIHAETEDLDALLPQISGKIAELGGYVESQELYNGSGSYRSRSLNMVARIPAERLAEFTAQVEDTSNVVNYSETTDDVTLKYTDTESRVKALEVEQERLLAMLEKAETLKDLLQIEDRLTDVRYELENYASQLRGLDNKINYATVTLNITQVRVYTEVEPLTVWQRIGKGFSENLDDIGEDLTDFFVWVTVYSPQLIFWAAVITVAVIVLKRKGLKNPVKKAKRANPEQQDEPKEG
jgi:hypothetical protein